MDGINVNRMIVVFATFYRANFNYIPMSSMLILIGNFRGLFGLILSSDALMMTACLDCGIDDDGIRGVLG